MILAMIQNVTQVTDLDAAIRQYTQAKYWIGLSDLTGAYAWNGLGKATTYTNWLSGQPSQSCPNAWSCSGVCSEPEQCTEVGYTSGSNGWNDILCSSPHAYVCQTITSEGEHMLQYVF